MTPSPFAPDSLVQPGRVHRVVYVDPAIFDAEMTRIYERTWIYCGHVSQIPKAGDYWLVRIGRQTLLMIRGDDGAVNVLHNRCPHRGVEVCGAHRGNAGPRIVCPYHAWTFRLDGSLESAPMARGYDGTGLDLAGADARLKPAARVDQYRGFVFAALTDEVPSLGQFLGEARIAFDDMCDRSPEGEVEIVPTCFRVVQKSNWKFFMENQLDALHAPLTHQSAADAAVEVEAGIAARGGQAGPRYRPLSMVRMPLPLWDKLQSIGYRYGHAALTGYLDVPGAGGKDAAMQAYEDQLAARMGRAKAVETLTRNLHHVLVYPSLSVQSAMQQLRVLRPIAPDRTLSELWHFRLKGAPAWTYARALNYFNLINSPSTLVNADDLENWSRGQRGLERDAGDWVSFHRDLGTDTLRDDGTMASRNGFSEAPMRHQFRAWAAYMSGTPQ